MATIEIKVGASHSWLMSDDAELKSRVIRLLSYTNKTAQFQLFRFIRSREHLEKRIEVTDQYLAAKHARLKELRAATHVVLAEEVNGGILFPTGLVRRVYGLVTADSRNTITVTDLRQFSTSRRSFPNTKPAFLRRPQQEVLDLIFNDWLPVIQGNGTINIATGVGKTVIGQEIIRHYGVRTLFLVPSRPIMKQTVKRFERVFGKENVGAYGDGKKNIRYITIATYQSVNRAPAGTFDDVDLVIGDEAHWVGAETFNSAVLGKAPKAVYRFGLSATPEDRADGADMMVEAGVGSVIYEYSAKQAIDDGYLARPTFIMYEVRSTAGEYQEFVTKYNPRSKRKERKPGAIVKSAEYTGSDQDLAYRNWVLGNDELTRVFAQMARQFAEAGKGVVILVDEIPHGQKLKSLLPEAGFAYGGNKENEAMQKAFNEGKLKVLIGTSCIGEGVDLIPVDVLIELQGGASRGKIKQADGRALRNDPDENGVARKPEALIIDVDPVAHKGLHRQAKAREKVHGEIGRVIRMHLL